MSWVRSLIDLTGLSRERWPTMTGICHGRMSPRVESPGRDSALSRALSCPVVSMTMRIRAWPLLFSIRGLLAESLVSQRLPSVRRRGRALLVASTHLMTSASEAEVRRSAAVPSPE
jgi:hypothetical protein